VARVTRVTLVKDVRRQLERGHPWIYASALKLPPRAPEAGALVDVADRDGRVLARGWFDPGSPIAVRVLARAGEDADVEARVASACALRASLRLPTDALRLLHGEADGLPGLVLDRYRDTGVVRFDGAGAAAFYRPRAAAIAAACARAGFPLARLWARDPDRDERGEALAGDTPGEVVIAERDARFEVDPVRGQKTGFFLDQRDNRRALGALAAGLDVLNLFSYTGGFSIAAALGGARRVTSVDAARPAVEAGRRNFARSGLDPDAHEHVAADAFAFLAESARAGRRWDLVISDPPSFAPSEKARPRALAAYRELHRAAAAVVAPGGLLAAASCSSHVGEAAFVETVAAGLADAGREGRVLDVRGADGDHPVDPAFPEGRYLKLVLVALD
jgi:23S rRNA (cytosine1962-C5)-methyltransferase